jgi:LytS/YehU family sensor histidine kinase
LFHKALEYRISRHLIFFLLLVLIFSMVLYSRSEGQQFMPFVKLTFINAIIFLGYGYLTIFVLIPLLLPERRYLLFSVTLLLLGFFLSFMKISISDFIFYSSISPEYLSSKGVLNLRYILINTKDMSFIVALMIVVKYTKDWLIEEKQHKLLQMKYDELNLRLLQSHFEPHFLFNTLNNLYALSLLNSDKTTDVIRKFKRILQFSINEAQLKRVPLEEELDMIQNFIGIEQIRYGDRLRIEYQISGSPRNLEVAPFILFTLVENCFKHGSSNDAGKPWIKLSLHHENGKIFFETRNSIPTKYLSNQIIQEKGLLKLRQRLELVYSKKYSLILKGESLEFSAKLELNSN